MKLYGTLLLCCVFLLASCGAATEIQDIEITFDGERCHYDGPEVSAEGQVIIILHNPTDHEHLHLHLFTFAEGYTWQDMVELQGGTTTPGPAPHWAHAISPTSLDGEASTNLFKERYYQEWEFSLDPGSYGILCAAHADPRGIWLAAPLEVGTVSSE